MKICCLLTGRGNNTLKDKNILDILGHPVLYYGANAAVKAKIFDALYCSSEDSKILNTAKNLGFKSIVRPIELGLQNAQHIDVIYHALNVMKEKDNYVPDILVVLLANNVTVSSTMLKDCVKELIDNFESVSSVIPVYNDNDHHPLRCKRIEDGKLVAYSNEEVVSTNRQDLPKCYFVSHNFWVLSTKRLLEKEMGDGPWTFFGKNVRPYEIDESIDIHDDLDLIKAGYWIKNNYFD